jgi:hypothetical protein
LQTFGLEILYNDLVQRYAFGVNKHSAVLHNDIEGNERRPNITKHITVLGISRLTVMGLADELMIGKSIPLRSSVMFQKHTNYY